jgi:peptidoglycan/LPS O-acetylase OafA/YrhL
LDAKFLLLILAFNLFDVKFYLKGLDTYRAIAALSVLVGHIELFKFNNHIPNLLNTPYFKYTSGREGVMLFFALSGYLITTLLLKEKARHQTIDLKSFYIRRLLRVWPLYFTIIILCLVVLQYRPSITTLLLCITIFPNVAHMLHLTWWASPQLWSLGVEEQFYIFWPVLVSKSKQLLLIMVFIFLFFTFGIGYLGSFIYKLTQNPAVLSMASEMAYDLKFNCMAAGGIMAILQHRKSKLLNVFKMHWSIAYGFILLPFVLWFSGYHGVVYVDEFYAVLFSISIWNIAENEIVTINPDISISKFLGKISYGIYMYHWLVFTLLMKYFSNYFATNSFTTNIVLYLSAFCITIAISTISYLYFEKWFLTIKDKFSRV